MHLLAVASKLYGYTLHLHPICGSKLHAREWLRAVFLVALTAWTHKQRRKGTCRLTKTICEDPSPDPFIPSSGCGPLPGRLGGWEHRGRWLMWLPAAVPVWYFKPTTSSRLGRYSKVHCIAFTSSTLIEL